MGKIRVLVADDSLTVRRFLVDALSVDPEFEVVGEARDGQEAVALCRDLKPDVVTLDMVMPLLDGIGATEQIMAYHPTPILIVSSASNRGEAFRTYDALSAGALDAMDKPDGRPEGDWERRFRSTLKLVSRIKVITHPRAKLGIPSQSPVSLPQPTRASGYELVVIGASTGGPTAIQRVLQGLPPTYPLPIVIVLHLGASFADSLVAWLNDASPIPVRMAKDGEPLPRVGTPQVLIAPGEQHLKLAGGLLRLSDEDEVHSSRPSVDILFHSVAREKPGRAIACLLTGMGRDGADGLLALRKTGSMTIAQDEETSIIYGMPRAAVQLGAASCVLPLEQIPASLTRLADAPQPSKGQE